MCGLIGFAGPGLPDRGSLTRLTATMSHRGPDGLGVWSDPYVAVGHTRLAVIDLAPEAAQPFVSSANDSVIVFNGEIYNYKSLRLQLRSLGSCFRTQSDTEVLLEAYRRWGMDCIHRFDGMFAFAIYDFIKKQVVLGRDRAGEKPLYYFQDNRRLAFASELRTLLAVRSAPACLSRQSLVDYLTRGYFSGPATPVHNVFKLMPGFVATFDIERGFFETKRYWTPPQQMDLGVPVEDLVGKLECLLEDAVSSQLVADVPVGILLSSGIDSGLIAALAARVSARPPRTFTVSFRGFGRIDEADAARELAAKIGTQHEEIVIEGDQDSLDEVLGKSMDEPIADPSIVPTFGLARRVRERCTVALGGDGGDELFAGYPHYRAKPVSKPSFLAEVVGRAASRLPSGLPGRGTALRQARSSSELLDPPALFDPRLIDWLTGQSGVARVRNCEPETGPWLQRALVRDFCSYLPDDILTKVDRASMASSLEVRAPWLDRRIIDFAMTEVPDRLRVSESTGKILPRMLAKKLLPTGTSTMPKRGFGPPIDAWVAGPWREKCCSVLLDSADGPFDKKRSEFLINSTRAGFANGVRVFALTAYEFWRHQTGLSNFGPP